MGGLIIFAAIAIPYLVLSDRDTESLCVFGVALGSAAIGFADDYIKIIKRRSLGLSARWKLSFQIALAVVLWWVAFQEVGLDPSLQIRIFDAEIYLGPVVYFVLDLPGASRGRRNGVNLTDGLDGLAAGCCAIVLLAYIGDHSITDRAAGPGAAVGLPRRRLRSASSGSTRSRPRSSWGTPARSASAARSRASR